MLDDRPHGSNIDLRRYPFQPVCSCGWSAPVFYRDAYLAMGHWWDHAQGALNAPAANETEARQIVSARPSGCLKAEGASPVPAAGALSA